MPLIVNPSSAVNWTLTRERVGDKALEKCQRLGIARTASPDDRNLCLEALDGILKNLLWYGYSWPKTASGFSTLVLTSGLPSIALPQDYYSGARLNYVDASGNEVWLPDPITPEEWRLTLNKSTQAYYPMKAYIDNFNVLYPWPLTNQSVTLNLYYQKVILDTVASSAVDLDSPWMIGLVYGVAAEIGDEFGVDPARIARFEAKWREQRALGVMNEAPPGPDRMSVSD